MESKLALNFFLFSKYNALIEDLKHVVGDEGNPVQFNSYIEIKDLIESFEKIDNTIVIFCVDSKDDCAKVLEALKLSKTFIQQKRIRFAGFNLTNDHGIEENLKKAGCRDILNTKEAHAKKLKFKIALWRKMLKAPLIDSMTGVSADHPAAEKSINEEIIGHRKELIASLPIERDVWAYRSDKDCDFEASSWFLKLEGPSPKNVFWDKSSKVIGGWEMFYSPSLPQDQKDKTGSWICLGEKPTYLDGEGVWLFKGQYITLSFKTKAEEFIKVETKDRVIRIARTKHQVEKVSPPEMPKRAPQPQTVAPEVAASKTVKPVVETAQPTHGAKVLPFQKNVAEEEFLAKVTQSATVEIKFIPFVSGKEDLNNARLCHFEDFYEHELTLLLPKGALVKADKYKVAFLFSYGEKKLAFVVEATIDEKVDYDETQDMLVCYVEKIDAKMMEQFMALYSQRQNNITEFLKTASGRE